MKKIILEKTDGSPVNKASINYNATYGYWFFYDRKLGGYIMIDSMGVLSTGKAQETEKFMKDQYKLRDCEFYHCTDTSMYGGLPDIYLSVLNVEFPPKQMNGRKSTIRKTVTRKPAVRKTVRK